MEKNASGCVTPSSENSPHQEEAEKIQGPNPDICERAPPTEGDDADSHLDETKDSPYAGEEDLRKAMYGVTTLNEVRDSLRTVGAGVEQLVTSVNDLLGLSSDSDSVESDCSYNSDGERNFSWHRLKERARKRRQRRRQLKNRAAQSAASAQGSGIPSAENQMGQGSDASQKSRDIMLEARDCTYEEFKSRRAGNEHKLYCIDVLIADESLEDEILSFEETVAGIKSGKIASWRPGQSARPTMTLGSNADSKKWIRRIRVNSAVVMKTLRYVCRESDDFEREEPTIFYRPFQILVHWYGDMKAQLEILRRLRDGEEVTDSVSPTLERSTSHDHAHDGTFQELFKEKAAIDELACFVDFMETRIMPDARLYRDPSSTEAQSIRYEDIWYLVKPGDLVYFPKDPSSGTAIKSSHSAHAIVRVILTCLTTTSSARGLPFFSETPAGSRWSVICDMIDHNGTSYASATLRFQTPIARFSGLKKVTDLEFYPASYLKDAHEFLAQAQSDGAKYISLLDRRFGSYSGWTQMSDAFGFSLTKSAGENSQSKSPEHIEGDVLVDYQETFNAFPSWKGTFLQVTIEADSIVSRSEVSSDSFDTLEWSETGKTHCTQIDHFLSTDETERVQSRAFLKTSKGPYVSVEGKSLTGEMLALVPRFFFGFAVLERKFVRLDVRCIRTLDQGDSDKAFARLEINPSYKKLILALVKSHFEKIEIQKRTHVEIESQDLIRGKGKGVIILLHGVPGVGKTATAEAVAQKWKRPLFPITCGSLGYTAETLEKSLAEIFRLAHHWDCVLLLDEADVFITRRERHDLKRNALVSAFLRVLEYYDGIMFLTTNRPGVLDDAVKSRVHLSLHYDHLNEEQTIAVYKQNIQRLKEIEKQRNSDSSERIVILHNEILKFAREHYKQSLENHGIGRWNGRQIRNAFLIASSLTHYDDEDEGELGDTDDLADPNVKVQKQLGRKQFETVAETTILYDKYRESVYSGKSDDHIAAEREERATSSLPTPQTPSRLKTPSNM